MLRGGSLQWPCRWRVPLFVFSAVTTLTNVALLVRVVYASDAVTKTASITRTKCANVKGHITNGGLRARMKALLAS